MQTPVGFLFFQIALAIQGPLRFHMNFKNFSNSVKNVIELNALFWQPIYDMKPHCPSLSQCVTWALSFVPLLSFHQRLFYLPTVCFLCPVPSNLEWQMPEIRSASLSLGSHFSFGLIAPFGIGLLCVQRACVPQTPRSLCYRVAREKLARSWCKHGHMANNACV